MKTLIKSSLVLLLLCNSGFAQLFSSGSDGSDGDLVFVAPPSPRNGPAIAYHGGFNRVFIFGGIDNDGQRTVDTWSYDGIAWVEEQPVFKPIPRNAAALSYDADRDALLLYGGFNLTNAAVSTETWQYESDRWVLKNPANDAGSAANRSMAFDNSRGVTVMFGGAGPINETWEYDGTNWQEIITTNTPPARRLGGLAYDSTRNVIVLFGGEGASGFLSDTWEYDGLNWTEVVTANQPTPRRGSAMAFDSRQSVMVLHGGSDGIDRGDTWEYDGINWTEQSPANAPSARVFSGIAYDEQRKRSVLFGGLTGSGRVGDTWEYDGTNWVENVTQNATPVIKLGNHPSVTQFSSVNVGPGVTVTFEPSTNNTPVVWLVSGDVTIDGTLELSGQDGDVALAQGKRPVGGPGGYAGGMGGIATSENMKSGEPGLGPGGGKPGLIQDEDGGDAGFADVGGGAMGGNAYGNVLNSPIIGGSGGGGGAAGAADDGGNGGGGGGALLIAASGKITVNGSILAQGGAGEDVATAGNGGAGSGGAIRLVSNRVEGSGDIDAGSNGRIRVEGFFVTLNGTFSPTESKAPPYALDLAGQGAIVITDVVGAVSYNVPANPGGDINNPDVIFSESGPVTINMDTTNIPQGTIIDVRITSGSSVIEVQSAGVAANGSASVTATVPAGVGTIQAFAEYTN